MSTETHFLSLLAQNGPTSSPESTCQTLERPMKAWVMVRNIFHPCAPLDLADLFARLLDVSMEWDQIMPFFRKHTRMQIWAKGSESTLVD